VKLLFLFAFTLLSLRSWPQTQNCRVSDISLKDTRQISEEILRQIQIQEFDRDANSYCTRNMLLRFINVNSNRVPEAKDCDGKSIAELEAIADKIISKTAGNDPSPWLLSIVPTESSMQNALTLTLGEVNFSNDRSLNYTESVLRRLKAPTTRQIAFSESRINEIEKRSLPIEDKKPNFLQKAALCAEMNLLETRSCAEGLNVIVEKMMPKSGVQITNLPSWKKIILNPKVQEGLRLSGLKIVERLKIRPPTDDNIFDDLVSSFKKSGLSNEESVDAAFNTLGVVANGGANTCIRAKDLTDGWVSTPAVATLCLMGTAMNVLDFRKSKAGLPPYSYPKSIKASCYYPKPYHFWMAADLSRTLVLQENISPSGASLATFGAQKGYQINRDLMGGTTAGISSIFNKNAFDPVHQVIRMDLSFAAAGAQFGASTNISKQIDVDNGIRQLISDAKILPPESVKTGGFINTLLNLKRWNSIFSPNSTFKAVVSPSPVRQ